MTINSIDLYGRSDENTHAISNTADKAMTCLLACLPLASWFLFRDGEMNFVEKANVNVSIQF